MKLQVNVTGRPCTFCPLPLFAVAVKGNATGASFGHVGGLGLQRMELLRTEDYDDLVAGGSLNSNTNGYFDDSEAGFLIRWSIQANTTPANTKIITVRALEIEGSTNSNTARDETFTTMRGR